MAVSNVRVVVLEDDILQRENLLADLSGLGYDNCLGFSSSDDMLSHLDTHQLDLALLDIDLGADDIDGIQVAERIKKQHAQARIVFISSHTDRSTLTRSQGISDANYLVKPVSDRQLYVCIERALALEHSDGSGRDGEAVYLKAKGKYYQRVEKDSILYLEAKDNGVIVYTEQYALYNYNSLSQLVQAIADPLIVRVHRKFAVRLTAIKHKSDLDLVMSDDSRVPLGKRFKANLEERITIIRPT